MITLAIHIQILSSSTIYIISQRVLHFSKALPSSLIREESSFEFQMSRNPLAFVVMNPPQGGEFSVPQTYSFLSSVNGLEIEYCRNRDEWELSLTLASLHGLEALCLNYEEGELRGACNTVTKEGRIYPHVFTLIEELPILFQAIYQQSLDEGEMNFLPHYLHIFLSRKGYNQAH